MKDDVEEFISKFKCKHKEELQETFAFGYCYWFAVILAKRFNGDIWYNHEYIHFATKIGDDLYDIYGKISKTEAPNLYKHWRNWNEFCLDNGDIIQSIIDSCILKIK